MDSDNEKLPSELHESDAVAALLMERMLREWVAELDRPHIVVCRILATGALSFQGPFMTALEAMAAAEAETRAEGDSGLELEFSVAPVYPPTHIP